MTFFCCKSGSQVGDASFAQEQDPTWGLDLHAERMVCCTPLISLGGWNDVISIYLLYRIGEHSDTQVSTWGWEMYADIMVCCTWMVEHFHM